MKLAFCCPNGWILNFPVESYLIPTSWGLCSGYDTMAYDGVNNSYLGRYIWNKMRQWCREFSVIQHWARQKSHNWHQFRCVCICMTITSCSYHEWIKCIIFAIQTRLILVLVLSSGIVGAFNAMVQLMYSSLCLWWVEDM